MEPKDLKVFTGVGPKLTHWRLGADRSRLEELDAWTLPANVQYAWPHPTRPVLYVASSDGGTRHGPLGTRHHITALSVDPDSGKLAIIGEPRPIPQRPIHVTVDPSGTHILVAFPRPSALHIYGIQPDASPGQEVTQPRPVELGNYAHQVRVTADGRCVLVPELGGNPYQGRPEEPGGLNLFKYADGILGERQHIAPNGGFGFGPRHVDFHPNGRWVYVSLERQSKLEMFELQDGALASQARFSCNLLSRPRTPGVVQGGSTVHVHPNGRFVYCANRASDTKDDGGVPVFAGGENTFAVFEIHPDTGEPTLIQHIETGGFHCRTFQTDASGTTMVGAHIQGMNVRDGAQVRFVPPTLSVFRIADDGRLHLEHIHPFETHGAHMFWMGIPW